VRWSTGTPPRLDRARLRLLRRELGAGDDPASYAPERAGTVRVAASRLDPAAATALRRAVGDAHVSTDPADRLRHAGGMSYADLLARREAPVVRTPDAVV